MCLQWERFQALWKRCEAPFDPRPVFENLWCRYREPHRIYHRCTHLVHCFQQLDLAYRLIQDPDAVEMALWFHDAIYIPGSSENEKESAELFVRAAGDHFRPSFIRKVYELILVTAHKELAQEYNEQFVADIDLSSFGVDWEEFLRDTKALRKEQADSSDAVFYPAHAKFLISLLGRPRIFGTEFFYGRYEQRARENITRLLADLVRKGYAF
jgi:predicted metal-dependent HD superfamily phosphohydrolase